MILYALSRREPFINEEKNTNDSDNEIKNKVKEARQLY